MLASRLPLISVRSAILFFGIAKSLIVPCLSKEPWEDLQEQNRLLRSQLQSQQHQLDELRSQVERLNEGRDAGPASGKASGSPSADRKLIVTGEVGAAFFAASRNGQYANKEFRIDDANVRVEASIAKNTYLFGEVQMAKREAGDENFHLGEFYFEFEDISGSWGGPTRLVNARVGRMDIPFGEEYQVRDPLTNPLVTHSLSDIWGTDEGIELFGEFGRSSYAFAVQNGSSKTMRDYNSDKSLTFRYGFDVTPKLHVSASAMRTGKLDSVREPMSEVWIGNSIFRNIGSAASTVHQAELGELDAIYRWSAGQLMVAGGRARYRDDDPRANNTRHFTYYQAEAMQLLTREWYAAARLSTLSVDDGYPLVGIGNFGQYFFGPLHTKSMRRMTLGAGYRFNRSLVLKLDYTFEDAKLTTGASRDTRMLSFESAIGF